MDANVLFEELAKHSEVKSFCNSKDFQENKDFFISLIPESEKHIILERIEGNINVPNDKYFRALKELSQSIKESLCVS